MTTKSLERDNEFVVIKHALKDMNGNLVGVRFRGGYAVVQKGSKTYNQLKMLPLVKNQPEFPLIHLRKLPFIVNAKQVELIYGPVVYREYLKVLHAEIDKEVFEREEKAAEEHVEVQRKCSYIPPSTGKLCQHDAHEKSPSGYCKLHLLDDPKLSEVGIVVPKRMTKQQKREFKEKVASKLDKAASN